MLVLIIFSLFKVNQEKLSLVMQVQCANSPPDDIVLSYSEINC